MRHAATPQATLWTAQPVDARLREPDRHVGVDCDCVVMDIQLDPADQQTVEHAAAMSPIRLIRSPAAGADAHACAGLPVVTRVTIDLRTRAGNTPVPALRDGHSDAGTVVEAIEVRLETNRKGKREDTLVLPSDLALVTGAHRYRPPNPPRMAVSRQRRGATISEITRRAAAAYFRPHDEVGADEWQRSYDRFRVNAARALAGIPLLAHEARHWLIGTITRNEILPLLPAEAAQTTIRIEPCGWIGIDHNYAAPMPGAR